jgi:hypothetical protein
VRVTVTNPEHATSYEVYLDGERLSDCVEANDETGVAIVYARNASGSCYIAHSALCRPVLKEVEHVVLVSDGKGNFISQHTVKVSIPICDCGLATKAVHGKVEIRRVKSIRDVWVSSGK